MDFFSLIFIGICFLIVLFVIHTVANDDFVLLRKHVTLTNLFDIAFVMLGIGLLSARFFYVLSHFSKGFLNPLVFFLFPYFPGLSIGGGIFGAIFFLLFYTNLKKLPTERIFDVFAISFLTSLPVGLLLLVPTIWKMPTALLFSLIIFVFLLAFLFFLFTLFQKGTMKDGSIGYISLSFFSAISFIMCFFYEKEKLFRIFSTDQIILFIFFIIFLFSFLRKEYFSAKRKSS